MNVKSTNESMWGFDLFNTIFFFTFGVLLKIKAKTV